MPKPAAKGLPVWVRVSDCVRRGSPLSGQHSIPDLPRVRAAVVDDAGGIQAVLRFSREGGHTEVVGHIDGQLSLRCERCLQPYLATVAVDVHWRLVGSDAEEARLLKECEPVRVEDDRLELRAALEDEVLLALPIVPRCADPGCELGHRVQD